MSEAKEDAKTGRKNGITKQRGGECGAAKEES